MTLCSFELPPELSEVEHTTLAYFYEIRSSNNTVLKRDGGFASQDAAKMGSA